MLVTLVSGGRRITGPGDIHSCMALWKSAQLSIVLHRDKELPVVKLLLRPIDDGTRSRSTIGRTASWGGTSAEAVLYSTAPDYSSSVE